MLGAFSKTLPHNFEGVSQNKIMSKVYSFCKKGLGIDGVTMKVMIET
jgi:hypothetical protein